jgi:hypothetical protein
MERRAKNLAIGALVLLGAAFAVAVWYKDPFHQPVEKVERLHGKTLEAVVAELGDAKETYTFSMPTEGTLDEFRIELHNTYPPNRPENADVVIKELHWEYLRYNLTVWFHLVDDKWVALDTCRWHKDMEF